jgi:phospholipase C
MRLVITCSVVVLGGTAAFLACSNSKSPNGNNGTPDASVVSDSGELDGGPAPEDAGYGFTTPDAWDQTFPRPSDDAAVAARAACSFARGAMPAQTLGASTPIDTEIPIENIVVVMMENRSFDSMFGHLNAYGNRTDVQEAPPNASNPAHAADWEDAGAPDGGEDGGDAGPQTFPWMHATSMCFADTDHSWKGQHWAWDNGLNDGFYAENNGNTDPGDLVPEAGSLLDGERAMWWYDQSDIPFDYQLANTFAIGDNYFCSLLGPTGPNREYLMAATSFGLTYNSLPGNLSPNVVDNVVVPDELEQRNVTWATYGDGTTSLASVLGIQTGTRYPQMIRYAFADFVTAAAKGTMPQVAWVDPAVGLADGTVTNNDDHPPADIQIGSQFLSQVYQAVTTSPQWAHTALFITWDENGGEYDHLPPSPACVPDNNPPQLTGTDVGIPGTFNRYGFRVPLIVVSPYAKKGYASHNVYDHTSIARFIEAKFKIPALTARDANADALMDLFDFTDPPAFLTPPSIPAPVVDDAGLATCIEQFGLSQ